jgi:putative SOS response-associated peptidase YedK
MCYQTRLIKKKEEIQQRFNVDIKALSSFEPKIVCKAFDFPKMPVITNKNPDKIELYNWGLIPQWAVDTSIRTYTLNARIETLDKKNAFKNSIENRCLIIADGFYEWQWLNKSGSKKQKFLITLPNESLFAFAGIFEQYTNDSKQILNTYTILTTQANTLMAQIHNTKKRMPVILSPDEENSWLNGTSYSAFQQPYSHSLKAREISEESDTNQLLLF